jgi:hypothetical protein
MTRRALLVIAALALVPAARLLPPVRPAQATVSALPKELSGPDLWKLSTELSEPDGYFRSDNLVSNELFMQQVIPDLIRVAKPGGVYMGVGPEQNFTYIAAIKPTMAFIVDIRRGNLQLHLMYKAIFELSADRNDFLSRLFSMKKRTGLDRHSTIREIVTAYGAPLLKSEELYKQNVAAIRELLTKKLSLSAEDLKGVERVYQEFFTRGLDIHYEITPGSFGAFPTYGELMVATDLASVPRGFLATEENFGLVRELHRKNLIVPVVGNFGGPKAIRAVAKYIRSHDAVVSAFYVSNVEQYLLREGGIDQFCASAATLPTDETSTFIRSERGGFGPRGSSGAPRGFGGFPGNFSSRLHNMQLDLKGCATIR